MLVDVNFKGNLCEALQVNGTIIKLDGKASSKVFSALKNGDHFYAAIMLDECSNTREIIKITAVDGALVATCRGVSHTTPTLFPRGSIVDTALAATAWAAEYLGGSRSADNNIDNGG